MSIAASRIALIREQIETSIQTKQKLLRNENGILEQVEALAAACVECIRQGGKVIFAGNGGSFADAQHLSGEFISRFMFDRRPIASVVLGTNSSTISSIGNDYGFEQVFARELEGLAKPGDVFIPISTSGNSKNILAAVTVAQTLGLKTMAFTGMGGGKLSGLCNCICIPSPSTPRIQECHITIGHILCGLVESALFGEAK